MQEDNTSQLAPQLLPDLKQISAKAEAIVPRKSNCAFKQCRYSFSPA